MAAPLGNKNAAKARRWLDAINKALARYTSEEVNAGEALDKIAEGVVIAALAGDWEAIAEIGNRLDGKAAQGVSITGADGGPIAMIWPLAKSTLDQP
jgi:hypothetical protein